MWHKILNHTWPSNLAHWFWGTDVSSTKTQTSTHLWRDCHVFSFTVTACASDLSERQKRPFRRYSTNLIFRSFFISVWLLKEATWFKRHMSIQRAFHSPVKLLKLSTIASSPRCFAELMNSAHTTLVCFPSFCTMRLDSANFLDLFTVLSDKRLLEEVFNSPCYHCATDLVWETNRIVNAWPNAGRPFSACLPHLALFLNLFAANPSNLIEVLVTVCCQLRRDHGLWQSWTTYQNYRFCKKECHSSLLSTWIPLSSDPSHRLSNGYPGPTPTLTFKLCTFRQRALTSKPGSMTNIKITFLTEHIHFSNSYCWTYPLCCIVSSKLCKLILVWGSINANTSKMRLFFNSWISG